MEGEFDDNLCHLENEVELIGDRVELAEANNEETVRVLRWVSKNLYHEIARLKKRISALERK